MCVGGRAQILKINKEHAVRQSDLIEIDVNDKLEPKKIRGKGKRLFVSCMYLYLTTD